MDLRLPHWFLLRRRALAPRLRVFGEISLSGDIRPVPQADARLKEAAKLGFKSAFVPAGTKAAVQGLH